MDDSALNCGGNGLGAVAHLEFGKGVFNVMFYR